jgi:hypothetical protein
MTLRITPFEVHSRTDSLFLIFGQLSYANRYANRYAN